MTESSQRHRREANKIGPIRVALVTVSDTRTPETDANGLFLKDRLVRSGHLMTAYELVPDDPDEVSRCLEHLTGGESQVILFNGGTGLSRRDRTYDVISRKLDRTLPGFGELFRILSWEEVGSAAMLSRAVAGVYRNCLVICLPGSPKAVRLAWEKLIAPEIAHLVWEIGR